MDIHSIAKELGLSDHELLSMARKMTGFASSLTPAEQSAMAKLSATESQKQTEIQKFLADHVAAGPQAYGICTFINGGGHQGSGD